MRKKKQKKIMNNYLLYPPEPFPNYPKLKIISATLEGLEFDNEKSEMEAIKLLCKQHGVSVHEFKQYRYMMGTSTPSNSKTNTLTIISGGGK